MRWTTEDIEIDGEAFELRRAGKVVATEPLVFDLIRFLAENQGRLLTRDDLIDAVWQGRFVSDATVAGCIKAARKALGDTGEAQRFIRTVRGRGFQFVPEVTCLTPDDEASPSGSAAKPKPAMPSLIILPFQAFGDAPHLAALADGLVENMTTALVRVPLLALASRSSSFALKGKAVSAADVRRDVGVDFMLEGSLQRLADKLRANVQLIETESGFHLWAQQFDCSDGEGVLDELLALILPRLEAQLVRAMFNGLGSDDDGELGARQLLLKATGLLSLKGWHRDTFEEAAGLLRRAISHEPNLALAHAHLALILGLGHRVGLLRETKKTIEEAVTEAEKALHLDNMDSVTLSHAACALADVGQAERALPMFKRAIELNPNNGHAFAALGSSQFILGKPDQAIENLEHSIRISPMDARLSIWTAVLALARLRLGDVTAAGEAAENACQADDRAYIPRIVKAAVHLAADDRGAAAAAMRDCLRVKPDLSNYEISSVVGRELGRSIILLKRPR